MIPDIGAPDMAIYVELVAPHNEKGYFGDDGFYLPGINTEVDFNVTKNDALVEFGPTVVSWEGRLVSTHIFVKQTANPTQITPDPAWQVEFSVEGTTVPTPRDFTFSIVQPQTLGNNGDITGINETIFGEGNLGVRSARGAIIVDSLILKDNTTYTITTNDPDGDLSNGNQGYFPAVFLSKGPIKGNNSIISVSSTNKNGGPGGGGGGGKFRDGVFGAQPEGADGGDGFTGGGKGGTNGTLGTENRHKDFGYGTGGRGVSYNGIPEEEPTNYEAAYGGTGHPFGTPGRQSNSGDNADVQGGYGGGAGHRNNTPGGSGGYATEGDGRTVTNGTTGGKVHGNEMTIPLAGGSGGAGGNPLLSDAGDGGGGGGALLLFAREIDGVSIHADGDDGQNGDANADGGPGSGGAAVIMSKVDIQNSTISASGGTRSGRNGGGGRIRFDGLKASNEISNTSPNASKYRGLSTDSSKIITPRGLFRGTHASLKEVSIYYKSETTDWELLRPAFGTSVGSITWGVNFDFDEFHDEEYYISAVQTETQSVDDYTYEPEKVLSQAATNIVRFGEPDIYFPEDTTFNVVNCSGATLVDSIQIQSIGGDYLLIKPWKLIFGDRGVDFTPFVSAKYIVPDGPDSLGYINFTYTKQPGHSGIITDTLYIFHDGVSFNDTVAIAININLQDVDVTFLNEQETQVIDTLDLGVICKGELANAKFNIRNDSEFDINNLDITIIDDGNGIASSFDAAPNNIGLIAKDQSAFIDVNFQDLSSTAYPNGVHAMLVVNSDECPDGIDTLILKVTVAEAELTFSEADNSLDFGSVTPNQTKDMTVIVTNTGAKPALIQTPPVIPAPFSFKSADQALPYLLQPVSDDPSAKLELTYTFAPIAEGDFKDSSLISSELNGTQGSCPTDKYLTLTGKSSLASIEYDDPVDFGLLYECDTDNKGFQIKNTSADTIVLTSYRIVDETPPNYFSVKIPPDTLFPGRFNSFGIDFIPPTNPSTSGVKTAKLLFEFDKTGGEVFEVTLIAEVDTFDIKLTPGSPFDLGDVPIGLDVPPKQITLNNQGKLPRTITGFTQEPNSKLTITKSGAGGFPVTIQPGGTQDFDVDIDLDILGPFTEDIVAEFFKCDNSISIEVIANGVEAELVIPTDLDLGVKSPCLDETIQVEFRNEGDAALVLDSIEVFRDGNLIFKISVDQVINEFDGTNPHFEDIDISDAVLPFGDYSATLIAYYTANGQNQTLPKEITAEIKSGLVISDNPTDFGTVFTGATESRTVNVAIDNTAPFAAGQDITVDIDNINFTPNYTEYSFISPNQMTINSTGTTDDNFNMDFTPSVIGNYDAILNVQVSLENGCTYFAPINLLADATEGDTLYVYAKDMLEVEPNIDDFKLPIYGRISNIANEDGKNVDARITKMIVRFNKTVFFPMSVTNGSLKSMKTDQTFTTVELDMETPVNVTEDEVILTELVGATLLGNEKENLVIVESSVETQDSIGISQITGNRSFFNLTICQEGGDRLLEYKNGLNYDLQQINGKISIEATLIESGKHTFSIMDMTGKKTLISEIERTRDSDSEISLEYDISNLTSGVYYIMLETPARIKTEKIVIVK